MITQAMITQAGRADAGAFLSRLVRLDPGAVVRVRPARLHPGVPDVAELWAMLPFGVLVVRLVAAPGPQGGDVTVEAAALLRSLESDEPPRRRDEAWRWPLPSHRGRAVETIPEVQITRVARAASQTLREASAHGLAGGRRVGERVLRDALLDHVPIVATGVDGERVEIPQRLVQAVARMGFVRPSSQSAEDDLTQSETSVTVRLSGRWIGLECSYGSAWYLRISPLRLS